MIAQNRLFFNDFTKKLCFYTKKFFCDIKKLYVKKACDVLQIGLTYAILVLKYIIVFDIFLIYKYIDKKYKRNILKS